MLNEFLLVLLLDLDEHAHDIPDQVGPAFRHTVQEHGFDQLPLLELAVQIVQVIGLGYESGHVRNFFTGKKMCRR